jgi:hypothetical protein
MDEQPTCGKGLAEHATLPAAVARLMAATAAMLDVHQKALVLEDENARREHDAYVKLAQAHRLVANQLQATAEQMAGYRDLPMGAHDRAVLMSSESADTFRAFVRQEQELLNLLQISHERDRKMLDEMQGGQKTRA